MVYPLSLISVCVCVCVYVVGTCPLFKRVLVVPTSAGLEIKVRLLLFGTGLLRDGRRVIQHCQTNINRPGWNHLYSSTHTHMYTAYVESQM